jgi:hypothetical protein
VTRPPLTYVVPLRWDDGADLTEMTGYLRGVAEYADVVVVDGSDRGAFLRHARAWSSFVRHVPPDPPRPFRNGKVEGVHTGVELARTEAVVIADDDVRYDRAGLERVVDLLGGADLVRPQNYFAPLPWHARWDTARTLLNRGFGRDYPGTFGVRRSTFRAMGGYDGDVLFENLELIRTVRAHGGTEAAPLDLYVRRTPPTAGRFWSQRLRQAYDDTAQPARMALFLAVGPLAVAAAVRRRPLPLLAGAAAAVALAETGRRRAGGAAVFPLSASLLAPVWVAERAVCAWPAFAAKAGGVGVAYAGSRLRTAAHSMRTLRRRTSPRPANGTGPTTRSPGETGPPGHSPDGVGPTEHSRDGVGPAGRGEPDALMGSVAEGLDRRRPASA